MKEKIKTEFVGMAEDFVDAVHFVLRFLLCCILLCLEMPQYLLHFAVRVTKNASELLDDIYNFVYWGDDE